jgi:hypothetical protein
MAKAVRSIDEDVLKIRLDSGRTVEEELKHLRGLASLLDSKFKVAGVKFGADAIVGLIPIAGDVVMLAAGLTALFTALRLRLPLHVALRVLLNLLMDTGLGAVPVVGDIFDVFFRSHSRNFRLLERHLVRRAEKQQRLPPS